MRLPAALITPVVLACALLVCWSPSALPAATDDEGIVIDSSIFGALRPRAIGPAVMSGRVTAIDAVAADPRILYVGAAAGGVWKSENGGVTFKPVFDDHCPSIGAIAIDQARPDTIWVGTGEPWVRNSVSVGDGVYRSTDGGESWQRMGLEDCERIGKIVIDPLDANTVYVAALGHLWGANPQRGLFKTTDGGATWQKILAVDETTGCTDVVLVPGAPNVLFAAMWQFRRGPDFFTSGGPGSGLHRSLDGGATWQKLTAGLPAGELGRIAIAISPARPNRIYAVVEAADTGFYRSDDLGATWTRTSESRAVKDRPFYFSLLVADPRDPDRVYKPGTTCWVSRDAGARWEPVGGWVHSDYHALWIDPRNPSHMVAGTDGGVYVTHNRGGEWWLCHGLPLSQFYRVSVDDAQPYWIYGGLQDNGSWRGPSESPGGIEDSDWQNLGGGDGFAAMRDPEDPDVVYFEWQGGNLNRLYLSTGDSKDIKPLPAPGEPRLRFNWNTPVATGSGRLYTGSQYVHRSTDRGESWQRLSPDLTTNDPRKLRQEQSGGLTVDNTTAENHCTVFTIAESPLDRTVIWAGTDDGNLQVTADDGATWRNVPPSGPELARGTWVSCVEPSRHARETAYATFDGHRRGDMAPHVYRTHDLGRTWEALSTEGVAGYCHVVREDPVNPDLLFLGTERGLFITVDGGRHWAQYREDFPVVPVNDLVIHPREHDLVIATHGRGIWIIDDFQPLRHLTREGLAQEVCLLPSPPAYQVTRQGKQHFPGENVFIARNPGEDARIIYALSKRHLVGEMKLEIFGPDGELVKTLPGGKRKGINLVSWEMRLKPPRVTSSGVLDPYTAFAGSVGPAAPEGTYTYKLTKGDQTHEGTIEVVADPRSPHDAADRRLQQQTVMTLYHHLEDISSVLETLRQARDEARERARGLEPKSDLRRRLETFATEAQTLRLEYIAPDEEIQGILGIRRLREELVQLYAAVAMYSGRPSESQLQRLPHFEQEIAGAHREADAFFAAKLPDVNGRLTKAGLTPIEEPKTQN